MPTLRLARSDDLERVVDLFLECWTVSYAKVMPNALVTSMHRSKALRLWEDALRNPEIETLVAVLPRQASLVIGLVGYSLPAPRMGYVASLYVLPEAQGSGTGRLLLAEAEKRLSDRGASHARLWVFEQNAPSRRFYERQGWVPDGTRVTRREWGEPQIGLTKTLRRWHPVATPRASPEAPWWMFE